MRTPTARRDPRRPRWIEAVLGATQRTVIATATSDAPRARRRSALILLSVFAPLGVLASLTADLEDFTSPVSIAGLAVAASAFAVAATTRRPEHQHRWGWFVALVTVALSLGIAQLGPGSLALLSQPVLLANWAALYLPTRLVLRTVVLIVAAATLAIPVSGNPGMAAVAVGITNLTLILTALLTHAALSALRDANAELDDARQLAQVLAATDSLTGVANRWSFATEVDRAAGERRGPLGLLIVDIDRFKELNDRCGHLAGDEVLRAVAERVRTAAPAATVVRWGGEEFVVLTSGQVPTVEIAEAVRASVAGSAVHTRTEPVACTVSVGATDWHPGVEDFDAALRRADEALYVAKAEGRNRVATHGGPATAGPRALAG